MRPLADLFEGILSAADLELILGEFQASNYLAMGRLGEWRPGERLNQLVDLQNVEYNLLSLYSKIQTTHARQIKILDQHTQRVLARVDREWLNHDRLTLEGRPLQVSWYDGEALWVNVQRGNATGEYLCYRSSHQVLCYDITRHIPTQLGLSSGTTPFLPYEEGWLWFHWLGDVYGRALLDLLRYKMSVQETTRPGICLVFREEPRDIPVWTEDYVRRYVYDHYRNYEAILALGAYYPLLPLAFRRRMVVEQFNVIGFVQAVANLNVMSVPETLVEPLQNLLL